MYPKSLTQALEQAAEVMLEADGRAVGYLYEDDGDGYGYRDGGYRVTEFSVGDEVITRVVEGGWEPGAWKIVTTRVSE